MDSRRTALPHGFSVLLYQRSEVIKHEITIRNQARKLAEQLELYLVKQGMRLGDPCPSTRKVADMFGVSPAQADQAIRLLVEAQKLIREDRIGTFVGHKLKTSADARVRTLYVLLGETHVSRQSSPMKWLTEGLHEHNRGVNIQFCFIPRYDELGYVRELIEAAQDNKQLEGVIAVSCSRAVRQYLVEQHVPLVFVGTPDLDQQHIPSIDEDQFRAGYILTTWLVKRGHRALALLASGEGRPGDHDFHDGVLEAMAVAGVPANALQIRTMPDDLSLFKLMCQTLLSDDGRPTGLICRRGGQVMQIILDVLHDKHLEVMKDVDVVFHALGEVPLEHRSYPYVQAKMMPEQIGDLIGQMINTLRKGQQPEKARLELQVELHNAYPASEGAKEDDNQEAAMRRSVNRHPSGSHTGHKAEGNA
ncbi:MAG: GntR family transcriptional regulator [Phycisphaeraceae bacterium]|nr:GntR family transcriptional regulator [Phycisphaeraceae bacterium]